MFLATVHTNKLLQQRLVFLLFIHAIILDSINRIYKAIKTKAQNANKLSPCQGGVLQRREGVKAHRATYCSPIREGGEDEIDFLKS